MCHYICAFSICFFFWSGNLRLSYFLYLIYFFLLSSGNLKLSYFVYLIYFFCSLAGILNYLIFFTSFIFLLIRYLKLSYFQGSSTFIHAVWNFHFSWLRKLIQLKPESTENGNKKQVSYLICNEQDGLVTPATEIKTSGKPNTGKVDQQEIF